MTATMVVLIMINMMMTHLMKNDEKSHNDGENDVVKDNDEHD